ncbi:MAG: hypothetical protein KDE27_26440 [Planctomycetes bacterium]|nr:hypothetical protein [Planctomycetota bacterium]
MRTSRLPFVAALGLTFHFPLPAQEPAAIPAAAQLESEFTAAQREWNEARRAGRDVGERPEATFVPRFLAGAEAFAGSERAVPYLVWLVQRAPIDVSQRSIATLVEHHVGSPGIRLAVARIGGLKQAFGVERSRAWLDRVLAENDDLAVRAQAHFTRAAMYVGTRAVATNAALRAQALVDLRDALALLESLDNADGASLHDLAARLLDEAERLEPGCVAPEIAGEDLDGIAFKLSDYRGKVVLLDFWGDW